MNYSFNKKFPRRVRELVISYQIADAAVKKIPRSRYGDALRRQLSEGYQYSWRIHVDDKREEVWLSCTYMWAMHCYLIDKAAGARLQSMIDLVEEW